MFYFLPSCSAREGSVTTFPGQFSRTECLSETTFDIIMRLAPRDHEEWTEAKHHNPNDLVDMGVFWERVSEVKS